MSYCLSSLYSVIIFFAGRAVCIFPIKILQLSVNQRMIMFFSTILFYFCPPACINKLTCFSSNRILVIVLQKRLKKHVKALLSWTEDWTTIVWPVQVNLSICADNWGSQSAIMALKNTVLRFINLLPGPLLHPFHPLQICSCSSFLPESFWELYLLLLFIATRLPLP